MEEKLFYKVTDKLNDLISSSEAHVIRSKEEFDNLSLKQLRTRIENAKKIISDMDIIMQVEMYHILGMGDLTMSQQSIFISKIKKLCSYRSYLKAIAGYQIQSTPTIPEKSNYNCKVLGINLSKNIGEQ